MSRVGSENDVGRPVSRRVMRGFHGSLLTAARAEYDDGAGMTISELARLSGVSVPTLHRWESGDSVPQIDKLREAAEVLGIGVPMERLIDIPRDERFPVDWRALFGLLQPTVGGMIGVKTSVVSAVERGSRPPTPKQAAALADIYGISTDEFLASWERVRNRPVGTGY